MSDPITPKTGRERAQNTLEPSAHPVGEEPEQGGYGQYGSSDDQWDIDRPPVPFRPAGQRYGILPEPAQATARALAPGYEAFDDAQPYRSERIYGWGPERYDDTSHPQVTPAKDELSRQGEAGGEAGGASLTDQFAGADSHVPGEHTPGWDTGARVMHAAGPRGDETLRHDICEQLGRAAELEVGDVSVRVVNGVVMLEGYVPYRGMKHAIEKIAVDCPGVIDVDNRIRVRSESQGKHDSGPGLTAATDDSQVLNGRQV